MAWHVWRSLHLQSSLVLDQVLISAQLILRSLIYKGYIVELSQFDVVHKRRRWVSNHFDGRNEIGSLRVAIAVTGATRIRIRKDGSCV